MSDELPAVSSRRLFLALWPEPADQQRWAALARQLRGGRLVHPDNLHLTLVFFGSTTPQREACYRQTLAGLTLPELELELDTLGYWPRPRVLWLGPSCMPPALPELVAELQNRLVACGHRPETRPYQAHITLARHHPGPAPVFPETAPLRWRPRRLVLVESLSTPHGVRYLPRHEWHRD
ncbi:MAG TPA: RNA 2',3'-cyclic phosphodiesterase [Candidatus Competibacteraceae bacterium]|nr:RNA 2',3'-cyclic phosphodiesterase [Candidatus Competibacteraceae bacterium]